MTKTKKILFQTSEAIMRAYEEAEGNIDYPLTNDYMFRAFLQTNEPVLRGLIGALLHLKQEEIVEIKILNPIVLGATINNKEFVLDIHILLNNNTRINLEMQVSNQENWPERALQYLCRSFDNLQKGAEYEETLPALHVGILDFTLFPDEPEFYAKNMPMNVKTHRIFSDKFVLGVLSLKQIELATKEDKEWHLDEWAKLFAAKTWREFKMIAKNNELFKSAGYELIKLNADEQIREQCRAREDYERHERTVKKQLRELKQALDEQAIALAEKDSALAEKDNALAEQAKEIECLKKLYEESLGK